MTQALRAVMWLIVALLALAVISVYTRPADSTPSPFAYAVAPEAAVEVTRLQLEAGTQQARINAERDAAIARERTWRIAIVCVGLVGTAVGGALVLHLARNRRPPVVILLPTDPRFNRALHDLGGVRINGVPRGANGEIVEYIEVEAER